VKRGEIIAGKYRIDGVIGTGGMGVVLAAHDIGLDRAVAIKFLHGVSASVAEFSARFRREARAMAKLKSEHVARVLDVGALTSGEPFMVMEHLEGTDLSSLVEKRGPLPVSEVADYVLQASEAIAEAHAQGIVHRDLKPSNMFLARTSDGASMVKLLDFGIAKMSSEGSEAQQSLTTTTALLGSPAYMSPEQLLCARDADPRSDIWSLGAIMHKLLTGRPPFVAETMPQVCTLIVSSPPAHVRDVRPDVPSEMQDVILRCLEKKPEDRFLNVAELARALAPFAPASAHTSVERATAMMRAVGDIVLESEAPPPGLRVPTNELSTSHRRTRTDQSRTRNQGDAARRIPTPAELRRYPWQTKKVAISAIAASVALAVLATLLVVLSSDHSSASTSPSASATAGVSAAPVAAPVPAAPAQPSNPTHVVPDPTVAAVPSAPSVVTVSPAVTPIVTNRTTIQVPTATTAPRRSPTKVNVDNREFGGRK
jgi:serine/threonine-protein kinase